MKYLFLIMPIFIVASSVWGQAALTKKPASPSFKRCESTDFNALDALENSKIDVQNPISSHGCPLTVQVSLGEGEFNVFTLTRIKPLKGLGTGCYYAGHKYFNQPTEMICFPKNN